MKATLVTALVLAAAVNVAVADPLAVGKGDDVAAVLTAQQGKRVTVRLSSGEELSGKIVLVGDRVVHLGELAGKEFFDAVIPFSAIEAIIARVRE
jgi:hypothetical protein